MSGFGDRVRIRPSKETEALGLAGREGEVFGWTTPSSTNVSVIGLNASDSAINVHFGDLDQSSWFSEELIEHLGIGVGTVITLDGVDTEWVRLENGDWKERPRSR